MLLWQNAGFTLSLPDPRLHQKWMTLATDFPTDITCIQSVCELALNMFVIAPGCLVPSPSCLAFVFSRYVSFAFQCIKCFSVLIYVALRQHLTTRRCMPWQRLGSIFLKYSSSCKAWVIIVDELNRDGTGGGGESPFATSSPVNGAGVGIGWALGRGLWISIFFDSKCLF